MGSIPGWGTASCSAGCRSRCWSSRSTYRLGPEATVDRDVNVSRPACQQRRFSITRRQDSQGTHRLHSGAAEQATGRKARDVAGDGIALEDASFRRLQRRHLCVAESELHGHGRLIAVTTSARVSSSVAAVGRPPKGHCRHSVDPHARSMPTRSCMQLRALPSGLSFRKAGVLFVTPISKGGWSSLTPLYSAAIRALAAFLFALGA